MGSVRTTFTIPVIDFAPFTNGGGAGQQQIAQEIYQACHQIGFMYLKNLGISQALIDRIFEQSQHFFSLPTAVKNQVAWSDAVSNRGYVGVERERLDETKPGDLKEAFNIGKEVSVSELESNPALTLNKWPEEPAFKETALAFYEASVAAADHVCQAFAIALDTPVSFFAEKHSQHDYTLRLLHYPPVQLPKPEQARAGAHSDYGSLTLLFQDEVGGLEVCTAQGEWVSAPYIPGTIVVNTGDLMQQWTNHVFCSTKHRVCLPADERLRRSRYSIALFCHPNYDAEIACLESCQSPSGPLYPPVKAGDYLLSRLQATY